MNRAVDGDVVAVEILPDEPNNEEIVLEQELRRWVDGNGSTVGSGSENKGALRVEGVGVVMDTAEPTPAMLEGLPEEGETKNEEKSTVAPVHAGQVGVGPTLATRNPTSSRGRVVGIIRRNWRHYAGSIDSSGVGDRVPSGARSGKGVVNSSLEGGVEDKVGVNVLMTVSVVS